MFKKDPTFEGGGSQDTMIAQGVRVEGDFVSQGNIIIEGEVHGTIKTEHDLRVGEQARIVAQVEAENAFVAGEVQGNLKIAERLELTPTARIIGDVDAKTISIAPGAIFCGRCMMPGGPDVQVVRAPALDRKRSLRAKVAPVETEEPQLS